MDVLSLVSVALVYIYLHRNSIIKLIRSHDFCSYEKYTTSDGKTKYATIGYTTVYLYYAYPQNIRPRISQMLVLPPFQGQGIGAQFVEVVYNKFKDDPKVIDITVEDPSDDFRRVRNYVDAKLCMDLPAFAPEQLRKGFSKEMIDEAKHKYKINPRQCRIVYEILRLNVTNENDPEDYKAYRLCVKKRLNVPHYKQKADIARMEKAGVDMQMTTASLPTTDERIEQLKEEYQVNSIEFAFEFARFINVDFSRLISRLMRMNIAEY